MYDSMMEDYFQNVHQLQYSQIDATLSCSETMPVLSFDQQQNFSLDEASDWLFTEPWPVDVNSGILSPSSGSEGTASITQQEQQPTSSPASQKAPISTSEQAIKVAARKAVSTLGSLYCPSE